MQLERARAVNSAAEPGCIYKKKRENKASEQIKRRARLQLVQYLSGAILRAQRMRPALISPRGRVVLLPDPSIATTHSEEQADNDFLIAQ
jgi:hypothetical protein